MVTFFTPVVAGGSILYLSGFARLGPRAVSIASLFQSIFGNVATRSSFAYLQSAAMSGYGLGLSNTTVRFVSGIGSVVRIFWGSKAIRMNEPWTVCKILLGIYLFVCFWLYFSMFWSRLELWATDYFMV
ncbi:hypothetical protein BCON_0001g00320 [Botryotinia convoluta]|uniref:Uncharacterized protein n=1 Tax=Botryotinia convoluta TaxID=54673 RepID=A0A4Z1IW83_9HELO|nr:hypothetical protein BCON_0001g00320 [Botryotinia convoluta]